MTPGHMQCMRLRAHPLLRQVTCMLYKSAYWAISLLPGLHVVCCLQGSRRHYCIHKTVSKEQGVDEACDTLMQYDGGCRHASRANLLSNKSDKLKASCCSMR